MLYGLKHLCMYYYDDMVLHGVAMWLVFDSIVLLLCVCISVNRLF